MPPNRVGKRAAVACQACNQRKVRCTVTLSGPPCVNCSIDGVSCVVLSRKRRRNSDLIPSVSTGGSKMAEDEAATASSQEPRPRLSTTTSPRQSPRVEKQSSVTRHGLDRSPPATDCTSGPSPEDVHLPPIVTENRPATTMLEYPLPSLAAITSATQCLSDFSDNAQDSSAFAETLDEVDDPVNGVPFYPGKSATLRNLAPHQPRFPTLYHFFVPMPSIESMQPEDVDYLRSKGVFSLPPQHIRETLIRAYFHHVHPFAPILAANDFIPKYEKGQVSLLLLWSMFLASASFVEDSLLCDDFYVSQLALKRAAYQRAKALYDADYEKDKITLIQSVFLMGHWYTSTEDRTGPWHWNGIAISLSQTIGLHRRPMLAPRASRQIPIFWRRLWWSIYCRETWLSLGQGRPMRLFLDDSDMPMPGQEDVQVLAAEASADVGHQYLPAELETLFEIWLCYVKVTKVLGTILSTNYTAKGTKPSRTDLEQSENEIRACFCLLPESASRGRVVSSHVYQFRLFFQTSIIVLYRPFIFDTPHELPENQQGSWRSFASQKALIAASEAIGAVNSMMAENLIGLCHTITVLALIPPMQIHLLESTSMKPMASQMGKHNLALCMLAMGELRKSYISADAAFKLFERARGKIEKAIVLEQTPYTPLEVPPTGEGWEGDCEGYAIATPTLFTDLLAPFSNPVSDNGLGMLHTDTWLDIQNMERTWSIDRFGLS
ncbi:hypothetical protein AK830_g929 [Neonectria ditissima]|uniref:Zn(2)-C6 fungal-type domain-containing protein n=1 Tax=Neonectria ditissima TaxID=78410 RepID=A0A0P7BK17_9HYPO|nr:hypothetical protein AK830_g929 [Neonectria ditissima]